MKKNILLASVFVISSFSVYGGPTEITPAMRAKAETAIRACEKSYQNTKDERKRFSKVKKPFLFASTKKKIAYKNLALNLKTFDINFAEFTRFTNSKIQVRTAKTPSQLRDEVTAYSSNCSRFASGLAGFVQWATTGKGPAGFDKIYQEWQKEAAK
tara:strand:+ start:2874 stop:3341 length:468 start_codon:yes stop_codon:yes gene_type:complete